jgi:phosphoglycerate dehydrogenase-like enzyme
MVGQCHPLLHAGQISESLQAELDIIVATTNAEEQLAQRRAEVTIAGTSASFKQLQYYRRQRKEILQKLIKEKREYIELLKQKIAEYDHPDEDQ